MMHLIRRCSQSIDGVRSSMDTRLIHELIGDFVEACHPSRLGEIDKWCFDSMDSMCWITTYAV